MRRRGLTVVEALVASGVVIVVLAVGYPAARALGVRSQHESCGQRLHTLGAAFAMYANDHDGWLPAATTAEFGYRDVKEVPAEELSASPQLLRAVMKPYAAQENAWFCPVDPKRGKSALWLGQRHQLSSFLFDPRIPGEEIVWPPKAQLAKMDVLASDAVGEPSKDSDPTFRAEKGAASNHDDGMVNAVRSDLSLFRRSARAWLAGAR